MAKGTVVLKSPDEPRNKYQSITLLEAIEENEFDCCIGGARRDEEKARAKERIMSFRDEFGQWDPKIKDLSYGTCTMQKFIRVRIFEPSLYQIGLKWMYGNTSKERI